MKRFLAVLAVGFVLAGCTGKPTLLPEEEASYNEIALLIDAAKIDLDSAARAGANDYAADSMRQAMADFQTASNTLDIKDFARAKEYAVKTGKEARDILTLPVNTQSTITDAESLLNSAKVAGVDVASPIDYKDAYDNLNAAKIAYDKNVFDVARAKALASLEASRKAMYEPSTARKSIAALANSLKLAKDLQMDTLKADVYNTGSEALASSSADFAAGLLPNAGDKADKAKTALDREMWAGVDLAIQQAGGDVNNAKEAGATEFASDQLAAAEKAIAAATNAQKSGEFLSAKKYAEKASASAKAAAEKARTGKEAAAVVKAPVIAEQPPVVDASVDMDMDTETVSQTPAKTLPPMVTREEPKKEAPKIEPTKETKIDEQVARPRKTGLQPTPAATTNTVAGAPVDGNMAVPIGVGVVIVIACLFLIRTLRMKITAAKRETEIQNQDHEVNQHLK